MRRSLADSAIWLVVAETTKIEHFVVYGYSKTKYEKKNVPLSLRKDSPLVAIETLSNEEIRISILRGCRRSNQLRRSLKANPSLLPLHSGISDTIPRN
jgi:hypothetical protein